MRTKCQVPVHPADPAMRTSLCSRTCFSLRIRSDPSASHLNSLKEVGYSSRSSRKPLQRREKVILHSQRVACFSSCFYRHSFNDTLKDETLQTTLSPPHCYYTVTAVILPLLCCYTAIILPLDCYNTTVTQPLYCCFTAVTLSLLSRYTAIILPWYSCYAAIVLLLFLHFTAVKHTFCDLR